jgi:hypothetical protein
MSIRSKSTDLDEQDVWVNWLSVPSLGGRDKATGDSLYYSVRAHYRLSENDALAGQIRRDMAFLVSPIITDDSEL